MNNTIAVPLTDELIRFVNSRVGDGSLYTTPDDYIRDLLRQKMLEVESQYVGESILAGLDDAAAGKTYEFNGDLRDVMSRVKN